MKNFSFPKGMMEYNSLPILRHKIITCPECLQLITGGSLAEHLITHHYPPTGHLLRCTICSRLIPINKIRRHVSSHHNLDIFICPACGLSSPNYLTIIQHQTKIRLIPTPLSPPPSPPQPSPSPQPLHNDDQPFRDIHHLPNNRPSPGPTASTPTSQPIAKPFNPPPSNLSPVITPRKSHRYKSQTIKFQSPCQQTPSPLPTTRRSTRNLTSFTPLLIILKKLPPFPSPSLPRHTQPPQHRPLTCTLCKNKNKFNQLYLLLLHIENFHSGGYFTCPQCNFSTPRIQNMILHKSHKKSHKCIHLPPSTFISHINPIPK